MGWYSADICAELAPNNVDVAVHLAVDNDAARGAVEGVQLPRNQLGVGPAADPHDEDVALEGGPRLQPHGGGRPGLHIDRHNSKA